MEGKKGEFTVSILVCGEDMLVVVLGTVPYFTISHHTCSPSYGTIRLLNDRVNNHFFVLTARLGNKKIKK